MSFRPAFEQYRHDHGHLSVIAKVAIKGRGAIRCVLNVLIPDLPMMDFIVDLPSASRTHLIDPVSSLFLI